MDVTMMPRPASERGRKPAIRPAGMPTKTEKTRATKASSRVAGMRVTISSHRRHAMDEREAEVRPWSADFTNSANCNQIGRSSPRRVIACSRSSWSASGLIRMSIGLPSA